MKYKRLKTKNLWCRKCKRLTTHMITDKGYECKRCKDLWNEKEVEKNRKLSKAVRGMGIILLITVVCIGLGSSFFIIMGNMGYGLSTVGCDSHSMWPQLKCNDILVYKTFNGFPYKDVIGIPNSEVMNASIPNGSMVIVDYYGVSFVHEVIGRCQMRTDTEYNYSYIDMIFDGVVTMGVNNTAPDGCIPLFAIKGVVVWHS